MRADQIIKQLWAIVPTLTDKFTDNVGIDSITSSGLTATVTTTSAHDLSTGDYVNIFGSRVPNALTSLTQSDNIALAKTTNPHDLTLGFKDTTVDPITIQGADQADYNGQFNLLSVPDRNTFTYQVTGNPTSPATGSPELLENLKYGYNGLHQITVTSSTTFEYTIPKVLGSPAKGNITCRAKPRISGAVTIDRAEESYTKQATNKLWAYVVLGERVANKSRQVNNDSINDPGLGAAFREFVLHPFNIYVFFPTTSEIGARKSRDEANDLLAVFCSSVTGITYPSEFNEDPYSRTVYQQDNFFSYNTAYYVHEYIFETSEYITFADTAGIDYGVAFRDIDIDYQSSLGGDTFTDNINLDEDIEI